MQHAVFVERGGVEWRETRDPRLEGGGEAIVRPLVVGRCDLDVAYLRGLLPMGAGEPIGHEIIGEVVEVGDQVRRFAPGQRVFVPAQISCGACRNCRQGLTGRCEAVPFGASYGMGRAGGFGGGLADLVRVPFAEAMLTPAPSNAPLVGLIGLADMAADAWRAVAPELTRRPGATVLVVGGMPPVIGLYAAGLAVSLGASVVSYVDQDERRREVATLYGAAAAAEIAADAQYDIVVVALPTRTALALAFRAAAPGGVVTSVTPAVDGAPQLDTASLYHRGVVWRIGRPDCRHAHDGALDAWANHGFRPERVPTAAVRWEDAAEAWSSDALYVAAVRPEAA